MDIQSMTSDEFIKHAMELRAEIVASEMRLFEFLLEGEKHPSIWNGCGLSFVEFIERSNICRATRYMRWKATVESHGVEAVQEAGVEAAIAAGSLPEEARADVLEQAAVSTKTNGAPPSEQHAQAIARDTKHRLLGLRTKGKGYSSLAQENEVLRQENVRLKEENALLKAELKMLKKPARKSDRPARKTAKAA